MKKLLLLSLTILLFSCGGGDGDNEPCGNQPNLQTNAINQVNYDTVTNTYIASLSGNIDNIPTGPNCEVLSVTSQGFVYDTNIQPTINDNVIQADGQQVSVQLSGLPNETVYYVRTYVTNPSGTFYGNQVSFETGNEICEVVYLAANGVTIKACPQANIGDVGVVNGEEYTVVDTDMFYEMVNEYGNGDTTKLCTTRVENMSAMGPTVAINMGDGSGYSLAGLVSHWDTSNVTDMSDMFNNLYNFNQDISNWDVSNVTNMIYMFARANSFNQDISSWDVSSVNDMGYMFNDAFDFNQPLNNWDVSNVTNMYNMFWQAPAFNQPLNDWDVSSVTNMGGMFSEATAFNQPLNGWNTISATGMGAMFYKSTFNQDISSWSVNGVTYCSAFSREAPLTDANTPNFTNCNPN